MILAQRSTERGVKEGGIVVMPEREKIRPVSDNGGELIIPVRSGSRLTPSQIETPSEQLPAIKQPPSEAAILIVAAVLLIILGVATYKIFRSK